MNTRFGSGIKNEPLLSADTTNFNNQCYDYQ